MVRKERAFSLAELGRRQRADILGVSTWVASPEDTILSKLEWSALAGGSARQMGDVRGVLAAQGTALDRAYLAAWAEPWASPRCWRCSRSSRPESPPNSARPPRRAQVGSPPRSMLPCAHAAFDPRPARLLPS